MVSQLLIFDQSRSASHLMLRILSKQDKLKPLGYSYGPARGPQVQWLMSDSWKDGMPEDIRTAYNQRIQDGTEKWRGGLEAAQKAGLISVLHEHPFSPVPPEVVLRYIEAVPAEGTVVPHASNFTLMPDELLLHPGTVPVLTIRDPRVAVPSAYRVLHNMGLPHGSGRPNFLISTVPFWIRMMYDYYTANGIEPVIVDADDLMTNPEFCRHLCLKLGLDPAQAIFSWPTPSQEEKDKLEPNYYASQKNLIDSTGVDPSKAAKNRDLDAENKKWDEDFGREDAMLVREMIKFATPHYKYLYERRLKL